MRTWIDALEDEDLNFIKRFVLASGSLKEMAQLYGVSYPTIRLRLDRLIEKIKAFEGAQNISEFERVLRMRFAEGKIDSETARALLAAYHKEREDHHENRLSLS